MKCNNIFCKQHAKFKIKVKNEFEWKTEYRCPKHYPPIGIYFKLIARLR